MPGTRHAKNNTALGYFTRHERSELGWGSQKKRLSKESIKHFYACSLCLKLCEDPMVCPHGDLFCKECIYQSLLSQSRRNTQKLKEYNQEQHVNQQKIQQKHRKNTVDQFLQFDSLQNEPNASSSTKPPHTTTNTSHPKATQNKKLACFWIPSLTPNAKPTALRAPDMNTYCPGCNKPLKRKQLVSCKFTLTVQDDAIRHKIKHKDTKKQKTKELKESKEKIKLKMQQQTTQKGDDDGKYDDDDEEIFIAPDVPELAVHTKDDDADGKDGKSDDEEDEKYEAEMVKEEFDPEKLNRLCSELCCMEHSMLVDCVLRIIESVIDDVYVRLDYDNLIRDMQNACYDPYGQNTKQMSDKDTNQYVDLALDILYCAGFVKRRFGDYEDERFHLSLADESDMWKLEATHELIAKYQLNMHDKKNRLDMLKAITFGGSNPIRYWKHIFDADAHGQTVRDRTVRLLKKICRGIIKNKDDLTHKTRNLNYALLRNKFECQIPLLLLQRHGFEQRENLYKGEIRFVYRHTDIKAIREMMSKIEDEEKCMSDQDILTSMPQRLQRLWIHVLSTIHGDHVRTVTITTIRQICNNIIKEPANLRHRDLDLQGLQRKFHCGVPLKLLMEYGFTQSVDPYRFEYRLRFDSSDITQIKTLLDVLEKGEKLNVMDIMKNMNRDGGMPMSVDQLRLIMALKALNDNQHMMNAWGDNANDLNIGMTPLTHPGHLGPFSGSGGPNTRGDAQRVLSAFDNNDNNNQFERSDMMGMNGSRMDTGDQEMEYMEMQSFLGTIGLASYAGSFIKNGIKTKHQLLKVDVSLIEFFIDNKMDQNKFINWLNSNKQTAAKNVGRISGI
eukprot:184379_1